MWQPLKNFVNSLSTYDLLSPDAGARSEVNRWLSSRTALSCDEWFTQHWVSLAMPKPLIEFLYDQLPSYSGLEIGRIRPSDRLVDDLQFPAVCWFNWGLILCEDFYAAFNLDITDDFDETQLITCADLACFLQQQLESMEPTLT